MTSTKFQSLSEMDKYTDLSEREQKEFIGKLGEAIRRDDFLFAVAKMIVESAGGKGLLKNLGIEAVSKNSDPEKHTL